MALDDVLNVLDYSEHRSGPAFARAVRSLIDPIAEIADPAAQAKAASELLSIFSMAEIAVATLRDVAIAELLDQGKTYSQVSTLTGISKSRVGQLRLRQK